MKIIDIHLQLDDIGLFRKRKPHEIRSQRERAEQIRDQFAECMQNALNGNGCVMPELCAEGKPILSCAHLHVDYGNFTGAGIRLTGKARTKIDERLRAIGTLVYRQQNDKVLGPRRAIGCLPGDVHIPALARISAFTGQRKTSRATAAKRARPSKRGRTSKASSVVGRILGSIFG